MSKAFNNEKIFNNKIYTNFKEMIRLYMRISGKNPIIFEKRKNTDRLRKILPLFAILPSASGISGRHRRSASVTGAMARKEAPQVRETRRNASTVVIKNEGLPPGGFFCKKNHFHNKNKNMSRGPRGSFFCIESIPAVADRLHGLT
ncbi:MAG: hypothetical protein KDG54_07400 [Geminicoccaceae bacterium]|nr:hypothetical protein [Geminicoccaceae bacterium]